MSLATALVGVGLQLVAFPVVGLAATPLQSGAARVLVSLIRGFPLCRHFDRVMRGGLE
ncbi:hypothetical protein OEZ60_13140 [Defluviimonas sp. WL0024]|uniref:Uncharacterized protein n=1 Tax=Albidovulum salinarum TaxID=2984153 RepID=A0ABT2XB37_9RHOB|nr:hypothetical protein [Defluviimonas sp. WL0024]MCU9848950.1 hypothetical protein [Defluviimonas sp. WL0024]